MNNKKISGALRTYVIWPIILIPFLLIMTIQLFTVNMYAGIIGSIYLAVYIVIALLLYNFNKATIMNNIINFAQSFNLAQQHLLDTMDIPYAHLDKDGHIIWGNELFIAITKTDNAESGKHISSVFPEINNDTLLSCDNTDSGNLSESEMHIQYSDSFLRVVIKKYSLHEFDFSEDETHLSLFAGSDTIYSLYLYDETDLINYMTCLEEQDLVVGLLYIDNYEDALGDTDEIQQTILMALVERQISKHIQQIDGIYRKMEKDRYFIIFQKKYLDVLKNNKFAILDDVRNVTVGSDDTNVSISIGLGVHADSYTKRYDYARTAIDLALGRGGDQAVIKDGENISYYGGKSIQKDSNTRVRARIKAQALNELMLAAEQIFIMGHTNCDIDSFGASVGIYRIAKTLERKACIVLDSDDTTSINDMLERYTSSSYYDDFIISCNEAIDKITPNTLLIIVDVNRANLTQCPELLKLTKHIVVIDHHRQTDERIDNQTLSYIEPFASSTCEMVTEFFQYISDGIRPRPLEADTLYSGIMVDTNNFSVQANVRTFEAVAYLKRNGADITRIRKMFRSNPSEYLLRAQAISTAKIYRESFAITTIPTDKVTDNPTVIGAKVANSLLEMNNIKASFVLSEYKSRIYINARSIDEVNVQVIMEKLGGGGHLSVAATQLDCTLDEAEKQLQTVLDTMIEEGDFK